MSWSLWAVPPGRYIYCGNNPVLFVDPTGTFLTHYVDQDYNTLLHTADGSDDVVMVPDSWTEAFRNFSGLYSSGGDHSVYDSRGWNNHWKSEFGLADRQFSDEAIAALDQFSTGWTRNNAASFLLKPTLGNALRMGVSEGLSQWTNPELVVGGLSAGMAGLQGISGRALGNVVKGGIQPLGLSSTGRTVATNLIEQLAMKEIMSNPMLGKTVLS